MCVRDPLLTSWNKTTTTSSLCSQFFVFFFFPYSFDLRFYFSLLLYLICLEKLMAESTFTHKNAWNTLPCLRQNNTPQKKHHEAFHITHFIPYAVCLSCLCTSEELILQMLDSEVCSFFFLFLLLFFG